MLLAILRVKKCQTSEMHQKMGKITEVNIKKIHEGKQGKHIVDHNNFSIHYSKSGTHVVPRKEQNNGKSGGNEKS